jgi:uncharacterized membrane protein YfcA
MSMLAALTWVVVGIVIGALSGFMGAAGAGVVLTPLLLYLGHKPSVATATSLAFIIPVGLAGVFRSRHDVNVQLSAVIAIGAVAGVYWIGRPLVEKFNIHPELYRRVFGVIMLLVALDMMSGFTERLKLRAAEVRNPVAEAR